MEKRLKVVEDKLANFGRRHDDCEQDRKVMSATLAEIVSWKKAIQESTEVNREMVEVAQSILKCLRWVGIAAKWITAVSAAAGAFIIALKILLGLKAL